MNSFTNPHQREVDLPEGCKDLIDVLHMSEQTLASEVTPATPQGFANIESYVWRMLGLLPKGRLLSVCCWEHEDKHLLTLFRPKGVLHVMMFFKGAEPTREKVAREIFQKAGIAPTQDELTGDAGNVSRCLLFPLPEIAPDAARLVSALLRNAYGLAADARLEFQYREKTVV